MRYLKIILLALASSHLFFGSASYAKETAKLGTSLPDSHPQTIGARKFSELVQEKSNEEIDIKVFSGGVLGNDVNMTSMLQAGTLDFTIPSTATLASINQNFSVISLPFQFNNEEHAYSVLDSEVGESLLSSLNEHNLTGLSYFENGFRHVTNSKKPVYTLEDLQGLKIRVMQNDLFIELFNTLKSNAIPMPVNELFTALETRTVDGQENPYTVVSANKFYEVQKYLSQTAHAYDAQVLLASNKFLAKLSSEQIEIIKAAANEATTYQRNISKELNTSLLTELSEQIEINEVDQAERQRMKEALTPLLDKYLGKLDQDFVNSFLAALNSNQ